GRGVRTGQVSLRTGEPATRGSGVPPRALDLQRHLAARTRLRWRESKAAPQGAVFHDDPAVAGTWLSLEPGCRGRGVPPRALYFDFQKRLKVKARLRWSKSRARGGTPLPQGSGTSCRP